MLEKINATSGYTASNTAGTVSSENEYYSDGSIFLEEKFEEIKDEQGIFGNCWNSIKEITNLGQSESDCENMLEKYNDGEVSFEEALEYINDYETKQDNVTDLGANILTGIGAIAAATTAASGPIGWATAAIVGAPVGAVVKTTIKTVERATNDTVGDTFDIKEMSKDAISGAVTGTTSAVSSGVAAGIKAGSAGLSVLNGVKCGAVCGAISGSSSYMTDVAFGDCDFDIGDLASSTLTNSFVSATVGGVVGGGIFENAKLSGNIGTAAVNATKTTGETIVQDSAASTTRKILGQAEKSALAA